MKLIYFALFAVLFSCQQNKSNIQSIKNIRDTNPLLTSDTISIESIDTASAKEWLTTTILNYFQGQHIDMQQLTTPQYYTFKLDAMNTGMNADVSLTEEEFKRKWKDKYDLNTHPIQVGFLISGQDWGKITLSAINAKETNDSNNSVMFSVTIRDEEYNIDYNRDITVVQNDHKYLIADVLEYD